LTKLEKNFFEEKTLFGIFCLVKKYVNFFEVLENKFDKAKKILFFLIPKYKIPIVNFSSSNK